MAALPVLFSTFALVYFTSQLAENTASGTPRRPLPGESLPLPIVSMAAESFPGSGLERRQGRVNSYRSASYLSHRRTLLKLNLFSVSVLQTAVTAEGGL